LDSFLGSGTTAIQAVAHNRLALGLDMHPAAVEIAKARIAPVFPGALDRSLQRIKRSLARCKKEKIDLPDDPGGWEWQRWFPEESHGVLSLLRRVILDVPRADVRRFLLVTTAGALKQVSYWYSHATKLQFDPHKKPLDVTETMSSRLLDAVTINQDLWDHVGGVLGARRRRAAANLSVGDCRALPFAAESADLAVSSPPYFTAYDYAKLLRLSSWWILGRVPDGTGHLETGGRTESAPQSKATQLGSRVYHLMARVQRKANQKEQSHSFSHVHALQRSIIPFFDGVNRALGELFRVLRPGGKLCLVLGNTRLCGVTVPTAEIASELALMHGFQLVAVHVRRQHSATQPQTRAASGRFTSEASPHQYSYRDEYVIVLRRPLH
jgi:DNA modification methylase